jgi:ABC-2 type transport system permease protein
MFATPAIDFGPVFSGYLGIVLVGGLFTSIGLFCSSLTKSQVVAVVLSMAILFLITIVPWWASNAILPQYWRTFVNQFVFRRYTDFSRGVIETGNLAFFILGSAVFIFLTIKVLEMRRWK